MKKIIILVLIVILSACNQTSTVKDPNNSNKTAVNTSKKPLMGWASWNNYRVNINETIIKSQADAMISKGLRCRILFYKYR